MTEKSIAETVKEAIRFIEVANKARERLLHGPIAFFGCPETASCRRASMDLTRKLAEMRKS
jgi:superfamily II helicase